MQKLQLTIPEPCHENWQHMTPTEQGRFCNSCAKEVIDFSTMTDIQVLNYFTNLTNEKVCGRALPEQLNRTLSRPEPPKKRLFWYWNYFVMFFMFFGKGNTAKAQGGIKRTTGGAVQVVTAAQLEKVKQANVNEALAGKVRGLIIAENKIINGKVSNRDGNPVSFALIEIKGTSKTVNADANGAYSLKANSNAMLVISGSGFKSAEIPVGSQIVLNTVLERIPGAELKEVVVTVAGGVMRRTFPVREANKIINEKHVIIFKVTADNTGLPIDNAAITITGEGNNLSDNMLSDNKGNYEFRETKMDVSYFIKVEAKGYEPSEFTIEAKDIKDRKKPWEVLLKQKKTESFKATGLAISKTEKPIRLMGSFSVVNKDKGPVFVVDGTITSDGGNLKPEDIEHVEILQGPKAAALFGADGANGAIVITTRKSKEKKLDTVTVTAFSNRLVGRLVTTTCTTTSVMGGMIAGVTVRSGNIVTDSLKMVVNKITGAIKIYPNPVQHGQPFNVALKLKQAGLYFMQITDATGRIMLQKQINANVKEHTEQVMPDSRWSSGAYYISIIDSKNKLVNKSGFIFR